ncbi:Cyclic nucleotide-binding domain-containing protein [Sulfidibacter corallicola]|uniref:Cyclic nucleotide-binding domain-containing protein n=1 Tax=Sulfidibacter corallicola TaxID=2818388 RepID=A0A8A4TY09_SULCO|nr:cyclic nucleotide-binding domain-containing protein [Sulfidibacter corallicola]QTD51415.1 cyclic nucleotide-binding domain-containing protein [Sulfidibacter corallicola]
MSKNGTKTPPESTPAGKPSKNTGPDKTIRKRAAQYSDRWSSYSLNNNITYISERLSAEDLRDYEIFREYSDNFLEKISPDIASVVWKKDALLFEEGTYIDLAFYVVEGEVEVSLEKGEKGTTTSEKVTAPGSAPPRGRADESRQTVFLDMVELSKELAKRSESKNITMLSAMDFNLPRDSKTRLGPGELFGEIGALSGWPQSVTARTLGDCRLIQIRLPALRLMKSKSPELKQHLDRLYRERSLYSQLKHTALFRGFGREHLEVLTDQVELVSLEPDQVFVHQGQPADSFFMVRSGFIKLLQRLGESDQVVSYLSKGQTLGEIELLIDGIDTWETSAVSVEYAELIKIPKRVILEVLAQQPKLEERLWRSAAERVRNNGMSRRNLSHSEFTQVALERGLVEGSSILVIDLTTCTRCDDCVRACAATHQGRPRFVREGDKIGNLLIPKSCYHCRDPVCLVGCPTGAIHRVGATEVVKIDPEICIGCSTCANNCPYDAIVMHDMDEKWPEDMIPSGLRGTPRLQASKCDLCYGTGHDPACVTNCPQGCASRLNDLGDFEHLFKGK